MIINLASKDCSYSHFPDGHLHRDATNLSELQAETHPHVVIKCRLKSFNDLFPVLQATDAVRRSTTNVKVSLYIAYLLAARYDRPMSKYDSFDLKIVADVINSQNYAQVQLFEPHSKTSLDLINRSISVSPLDGPVTHMLEDWKVVDDSYTDVCLVAPDLGAVKRLEVFASKLPHSLPLVLCNKHRNLRTAAILSLDILTPNEVRKSCIIYDDLCDGGRTFIEVAAKLRDHGAQHITLAVTHGLFTQGTDALLTPTDDGKYVDQILTTNSYQDLNYDPSHKLLITKVI